MEGNIAYLKKNKGDYYLRKKYGDVILEIVKRDIVKQDDVTPVVNAANSEKMKNKGINFILSSSI